MDLMLDLVLSLSALIAGGFIIELFAAGSSALGRSTDYRRRLELEELHVGNPS